MNTFLLEKMSSMYAKLDSVMITNSNGIIEYSALFDQDNHTINNAGYTGYNILEVYPELTPETSSHYRVMRTGRPIINERQTLIDRNGKKIMLFSSTYPIEVNGEIMGAIEGVVYLDENGQPFKKPTTPITKELPQSNTCVDHLYTLDDIITGDTRMMLIKDNIERIAAGDSYVLITGNTGTGKELVAQSLHTSSHRCDKPFVSQNCAAIPTGLLESTLFGTTKGCYTGAIDKRGLFEIAEGGTLFLDELNSMDLSLQSKLLRAIEERKIRRIGGEKEYNINVRVVSAMNANPRDVISSGLLRQDLYYRLAVVVIELPDLKDRGNDIQILTNRFIDNYNRLTNKKIIGCSEIVQNVFKSYMWPGNVRELKNAIEYAFNMCRDIEITLSDIPESILYPEDNGPCLSSETNADLLGFWANRLKSSACLTDVVNKFENELIVNAISNNKSITDAAKSLGITRQALNYKLEKYGIK